ncbi:hypothetical protein CEE58_16010 [Stenotrophomonas maltophilia]|uniref:hypothetical protein n=1 Tax=Stenotrophomonas maltophilia TaxID=40324 RepID=UPI000B4C74CB|nr:hypothetical protein [Stenotrophomonas maltophilia]OWQ61331.1 hypothetical protein CEE58_16010 [Stenotrophomonas maltophilia]
MTRIHVQQTFDQSPEAEKDRQRAELADHVARFKAAGGTIQVLGNTPIDRTTISRRQVVEGGLRNRTKKGTHA